PARSSASTAASAARRSDCGSRSGGRRFPRAAFWVRFAGNRFQSRKHALTVASDQEKPAALASPQRLRLRVPEELGVLAALALLVTIVGVHNSAFVQPQNLLNLVASNSFF